MLYWEVIILKNVAQGRMDSAGLTLKFLIVKEICTEAFSDIDFID